jgi:hypothetical protein
MTQRAGDRLLSRSSPIVHPEEERQDVDGGANPDGQQEPGEHLHGKRDRHARECHGPERAEQCQQQHQQRESDTRQPAAQEVEQERDHEDRGAHEDGDVALDHRHQRGLRHRSARVVEVDQPLERPCALQDLFAGEEGRRGRRVANLGEEGLVGAIDLEGGELGEEPEREEPHQRDHGRGVARDEAAPALEAGVGGDSEARGGLSVPDPPGVTSPR